MTIPQNVDRIEPNGSPLRPLNCVLIGCGAITELQYVPAIKALADINVVGALDPAPGRIHAIKRHFPEATEISNVQDLAGTKADFAIVASPAAYHATQTISAMRAGLHVLCEKPMASSASEAEQMVESADHEGRLLAVGLFRRFFPATRAIAEFIANGTLGKVVRYQIAEGGEFDWPAVSATFFQKAHSKGGVLLDLGAHTLDLVRHWFGEPDEIGYEDDAEGGLEASCFIQMEHPNEVRGGVRLSREWRTPNRYFIEFERGWLAWSPSGANRLEFGATGCSYAGQVELAEPTLSWGLPAVGAPGLTYSQCFTAQLQQFANAIRHGEEPAVTGRDGLANLRLIERCYEQTRGGGQP